MRALRVRAHPTTTSESLLQARIVELETELLACKKELGRRSLPRVSSTSRVLTRTTCSLALGSSVDRLAGNDRASGPLIPLYAYTDERGCAIVPIQQTNCVDELTLVVGLQPNYTAHVMPLSRSYFMMSGDTMYVPIPTVPPGPETFRW